MATSHQVSPDLLPDVCWLLPNLVHESGIIRAQMGMHNSSEMVTVLGTPCAITPPTVTVRAGEENVWP
jgi:hypothetical protein